MGTLKARVFSTPLGRSELGPFKSFASPVDVLSLPRTRSSKDVEKSRCQRSLSLAGGNKQLANLTTIAMLAPNGETTLLEGGGGALGKISSRSSSCLATSSQTSTRS